MQTEAGEHVVEIEGGELAVMAPLEAGAGGQVHPGVAGGPNHSGTDRSGKVAGGQVHGEAEMC
jgi:hypothetical protein